MRLSAIVITLNEEANIERCLQSVSFASEIIVVDSHSSDRTVELASRYTDKVSQRRFTGFSDQWNAAIELATQDWIFLIGADEFVTDSLCAEIEQVMEHATHSGYRMPRLSYFLGNPIRHCGWYPDYQLRLARRSQAHMPDRLVHEHLEVDGTVGSLKNPLMHYSYVSMGDYTRKMVHYTRAAAEQKLREGRKLRLSDIVFTPGLTFVKMYILKQGFRDGLHGFILSCLSASAIFLRYATLWDMSRREDPVKEQTRI